jgi:site-specific recombinase XerD
VICCYGNCKNNVYFTIIFIPVYLTHRSRYIITVEPVEETPSEARHCPKKPDSEKNIKILAFNEILKEYEVYLVRTAKCKNTTNEYTQSYHKSTLATIRHILSEVPASNLEEIGQAAYLERVHTEYVEKILLGEADPAPKKTARTLMGEMYKLKGFLYFLKKKKLPELDYASVTDQVRHWSSLMRPRIRQQRTENSLKRRKDRLLPEHIKKVDTGKTAVRAKMILKEIDGVPTNAEFFTVRNFLMYCLATQNANRTNAFRALTMAVYEDRHYVENSGSTTFPLSQHKTSQYHGILDLAVDENTAHNMELYVQRVRAPLMRAQGLEPNQGDSPVFPTLRGGMISTTEVSKIFRSLFKAEGLTVTATPTAIRHCVATSTFRGVTDVERRMVVKQMKHSSRTHETYYNDATGPELAATASAIIKKVIRAESQAPVTTVSDVTDKAAGETPRASTQPRSVAQVSPTATAVQLVDSGTKRKTHLNPVVVLKRLELHVDSPTTNVTAGNYKG